MKTENNKKFKLFVGLKKLDEFDSILEAKQYASKSGLTGVFNLLGDNYSDSWYVSKSELKNIQGRPPEE
jgi:hypothetical protein